MIHTFKGIAVVETRTQNYSEDVDLDFEIESAGDEWLWKLDGYGRDGFLVSNDTYPTKEAAIENANAYGESWVVMREDRMRNELESRGALCV